MPPGNRPLNIYAWNKMLSRYTKAGEYRKTLDLFHQMQKECMNPDSFTFVPVLTACSGLQSLEEGKLIHAHVMRRGYELNVYVCSCLVNMYAKCGSIKDARNVFNQMSIRDAVSWNTMILGYVNCGEGERALQLFRQMHREGVKPSPVTFVGVLKACAGLGALAEGKHVHQHMIHNACESNVFAACSLIDMYTKCGSIDNAQEVFDKMSKRDVVTWNTIIHGHVKCGQGYRALELFVQMEQERIKPNAGTFVALLNACASLGALKEGQHVHQHIIRSGFETNVIVGSSLVDMYAKCRQIEDAWSVFKKMPTRSVAAWTAMILGYTKGGAGQKAFELSKQMQQEGVEPDSIAFVAVVNACASVEALEEGRHIHEKIIQKGWDSDVFVGSSLVDMYSKCGSIQDARRTFDKMSSRNGVSWASMMAGYAMHGHAKEALELFERMCEEGAEMNQITFVSLLSACCHGGLVDEGLHYLESMSAGYGIASALSHYACVIDLLGRVGCLHEAQDLMKVMCCEPDAAVWKSLLAACRIHGNVEMAEELAKRVLLMEPESVAGPVLLSNIYAAAG